MALARAIADLFEDAHVGLVTAAHRAEDGNFQRADELVGGAIADLQRLREKLQREGARRRRS